MSKKSISASPKGPDFQWKLWFLFLAFLAAPIFLVAQSELKKWQDNLEPSHRILDELQKKGSYIFTIFQASNGATWLGTGTGKYLYQNKEFTQIETGLDNPDAQNIVFEICEDEDGKIAFGANDNTLRIYDNDTLYPYKYNQLLQDSIPSGRYFHNIQLENKSFYFSNKANGVIQIDSSGRWNDSLFASDQPDQTVDVQILQLEKSIVAGIKSYPKDPQKLRIQVRGSSQDRIDTYVLPFKNNPKHSRRIRVHTARTNGLLFIGIENKVYSINNGNVRLLFETDNYINSLACDQFNQLWVCTNEGALIYGKNKDYTQLKYHWFKEHDLIVKGQLEDNEGMAWAYSYGKGPLIIPHQQIKQVPGFKRNENTILSFAKDEENHLWVLLSSEDVMRVSPKGDTTYYHYPLNIKTRHRLPYLFFHQTSKSLWLMRSGSTLRIDGEYRHKPKVYPMAKSVSFSSSGHLLLIYTNYITEIRNDTIYKTTREKDRLLITGIEAGSNDTMYLSTANGLRYYINGNIYSYQNQDSLLQKNILEMVQRSDSTLVLLFEDHSGLGFYKNGTTSSWSHPIFELLAGQFRYIENDCFLLIGFHKYLINITDADTQIVVVPNLDGLPFSNRLRGNTYWNGMFWQSSPDGLIAFDSIYLHERPEQVTSFEVAGLKVNGRRKEIKSSYLLPHDQNNLNVIFHSYSSIARLPQFYWYRMKQIDENWTRSKYNQVQYTTLAPGEYTFELMTQHLDAQPSDFIKTISITILPPFYATWWFRTTWILAALGLVYGIYRFQIRRIKTVNSLREKAVKHQQQALTAQMNPHFIFNSMNSVQQFWLENKQELAMSFMGNFGKLIRRVMEHSAYEYISLQEEIDTLTIYLNLEQGRLEGHFDYVIDVDPSVDPQEAEIPPLLIQPYVENAIWHGIRPLESGGLISIQFSKNARQGILCVIKDNGVGRSKSSNPTAEHQSRGMQKTASRLEILSQRSKEPFSLEIIDLVDQPGAESGTEVRFSIPERY